MEKMVLMLDVQHSSIQNNFHFLLKILKLYKNYLFHHLIIPKKRNNQNGIYLKPRSITKGYL